MIHICALCFFVFSIDSARWCACAMLSFLYQHYQWYWFDHGIGNGDHCHPLMCTHNLSAVWSIVRRAQQSSIFPFPRLRLPLSSLSLHSECYLSAFRSSYVSHFKCFVLNEGSEHFSWTPLYWCSNNKSKRQRSLRAHSLGPLFNRYADELWLRLLIVIYGR